LLFLSKEKEVKKWTSKSGSISSRIGATGHTNITLTSRDGTSYTYGANLAPSVGVQDEHALTLARIASNPSAYSYSDITISESTFNSILAFAQTADAGNNSYSIFCNNCVDFVDRALTFTGAERFSSHQYLRDGTLLDVYAKLTAYVCDPENVSGWAHNYGRHLDRGDEYMRGVIEDRTGVRLGIDSFSFFHAFNALKEILGISSWDDEVQDNEIHVLNNADTPLIIDLNHDGVKTISLENSSVLFDIIGDGVQRKTGWIDQNDGFLVQDSNSNGLIDNIHEMFGGSGRAAGFNKLSLLDSNQDGFITLQDSGFTSLLIWQDANSDGTSQPSELATLEDWEISSIDLSYETTAIYDNGNFIGEVSTVIIGGSTTVIGDTYFSTEQA